MGPNVSPPRSVAIDGGVASGNRQLKKDVWVEHGEGR